MVKTLKPSQSARLPGYRIRIVDGNHLGATEHRLKPLQATRSGPLPGQSIAVLDPEQQLVTDIFPCEDAHAQERSLLSEMLETVQANDVWIADRNFCTRAALLGIAQWQGYFITRAHQSLPWQALKPLKSVGASKTGAVFEQLVRITHEGISLTLRRIVVKLAEPTRHGDSEVAVFRNLLPTVATAPIVAELYLERWTIATIRTQPARAWHLFRCQSWWRARQRDSRSASPLLGE